MRRPNKKRHIFLFFLLFLTVVGIVCLSTDIFEVGDIIIDGNKKIPKEEVISRAGIPEKQNILKINKQLIKDRIETQPYLEVISIKRKYPHDIIINLKEKEASAIVPFLNTYYVIDNECYILEIAQSLDDFAYPLIRGIQVRNFSLGKRLEVSDEYQIKALLKVLGSIEEMELQDEVSEIIMDNPEGIEIMLTDGIRTKIGQAVEMDKKLIWLKSGEIKATLKGLRGGILDLSVPSKPVFYPDES